MRPCQAEMQSQAAEASIGLIKGDELRAASAAGAGAVAVASAEAKTESRDTTVHDRTDKN